MIYVAEYGWHVDLDDFCSCEKRQQEVWLVRCDSQ